MTQSASIATSNPRFVNSVGLGTQSGQEYSLGWVWVIGMEIHSGVIIVDDRRSGGSKHLLHYSASRLGATQ